MRRGMRGGGPRGQPFLTWTCADSAPQIGRRQAHQITVALRAQVPGLRGACHPHIPSARRCRLPSRCVLPLLSPALRHQEDILAPLDETLAFQLPLTLCHWVTSGNDGGTWPGSPTPQVPSPLGSGYHLVHTQDRVIVGRDCIYPKEIRPFRMGQKY